ncbi:hypothetical protein [Ferruginibacter profundus]
MKNHLRNVNGFLFSADATRHILNYNSGNTFFNSTTGTLFLHVVVSNFV